MNEKTTINLIFDISMIFKLITKYEFDLICESLGGLNKFLELICHYGYLKRRFNQIYITSYESDILRTALSTKQNEVLFTLIDYVSNVLNVEIETILEAGLDYRELEYHCNGYIYATGECRLN